MEAVGRVGSSDPWQQDVMVRCRNEYRRHRSVAPHYSSMKHALLVGCLLMHCRWLPGCWLLGLALFSYGSSDGGCNVHRTHPGLASAMADAGRKLNLASHAVIGTPTPDTILPAGDTHVRLVGPGDMEGHVGEDGTLECLFPCL